MGIGAAELPELNSLSAGLGHPAKNTARQRGFLPIGLLIAGGWMEEFSRVFAEVSPKAPSRKSLPLSSLPQETGTSGGKMFRIACTYLDERSACAHKQVVQLHSLERIISRPFGTAICFAFLSIGDCAE